MAKIIDGLIFTSAYLLVAYSLLIKKMDRWGAIFIAIASYLILGFVWFLIGAKKKGKKEVSAEEVPTYLALMPREEQTELFYNLVPDSMKVSFKNPYFIYLREEKRVLVAVLYRFLNLTQEDIASAYREAVAENCTEIIMLTRARERKTLTLTALLPIKFVFPDKYTVYRALKKHNALPVRPERPKKVKIKPDKHLIIDNILSQKKCKFYILISLILVVMSFITPLKTYYLIMATIPLILSIIAIIRKRILEK